MKKIFIVIGSILLSAGLLQAQTDTMYIMKAGVVIEKYNVKTQLDSVTFYQPMKVTENKYLYDHFTSITKMIAAESNAPIQTAGNFEFRLTDTATPRTIDSYELLQGKKGSGRKPVVTTSEIFGVNSEGLQTGYITLSDVGKSDMLYYIGVYDNIGMIYKSTYGEPLSIIFNLKLVCPNLFQIGICKELPNGELLISAVLKDYVESVGRDVFTSVLLYTTKGQKVINACHNKFDEMFTLSKYNADNGFQVYGTVKNGWSYSAYNNYVFVSEYGEASNPRNEEPKDIFGYASVGYMRVGSAFLSTDWGVTFNEVFNYFDKDENGYYIHLTDDLNYLINTSSSVTYRSNHIHGCFIDQYMKAIVPKPSYIDSTINNDVYSQYNITVPRLVVLTGDGDTEHGMFFSDDLGVTWNNIGTSFKFQCVSGMATPKGYLLTSDNVYPSTNGVQLVHRAKEAANMDFDNVFTAMRQADYLNPLVNPAGTLGTGRVYYVGGNITRRDDDSPIITVFQPERIAYYNTEKLRGCVAISYDEGISWERIYEDDIHLKCIQYATVYQLANGTILLSPVANYLNTPTTSNPNALGGKIIEIKI